MEREYNEEYTLGCEVDKRHIKYIQTPGEDSFKIEEEFENQLIKNERNL